jgi:hypothetical protein
MTVGVHKTMKGALLVSLITSSACGSSPAQGEFQPGEELVCDLDLALIADGGVGRDGIPALTDPLFLPALPRTDENSYFRPTDRVIAYWSAGEWLVIPHNIMWRHEIVNLPEVAISYCPLTGSALAFSRLSAGGAEFGVSGLLYQANLIMYDRTEPESLWPQMLGEARCGPKSGQKLERVPLIEMPWEAWIELHPDSKVLTLTPEMDDPTWYFDNPYGSFYGNLYNDDFLGFPIPIDDRRPPKELVLGVPEDNGRSTAFPFLAMEEVGQKAVIEFEYDGEPAIVLFDASRQAAGAYRATVEGQDATLTATLHGFVDDVTGTTWAVDGTPLSGPLAGSGGATLRQIPDAHVAFWGAWAAFNQGTTLAVGG